MANLNNQNQLLDLVRLAQKDDSFGIQIQGLLREADIDRFYKLGRLLDDLEQKQAPPEFIELISLLKLPKIAHAVLAAIHLH